MNPTPNEAGSMAQPMTMDSGDTSIQRDYQMNLNEQTFSHIQHQYAEAERDVNFLREALLAAETRYNVLARSMEELSGPQKTVPGATLR